MNEQKPCPFCGSTDTRCHNFGDECNNCGSRVVFMDLSDLHGSDVRPNYNTRPIEDALRAELEKTQKALELACRSFNDRLNDCPPGEHWSVYCEEDYADSCIHCWKEYFMQKAGE